MHPASFITWPPGRVEEAVNTLLSPNRVDIANVFANNCLFTQDKSESNISIRLEPCSARLLMSLQPPSGQSCVFLLVLPVGCSSFTVKNDVRAQFDSKRTVSHSLLKV